MIRLRWTTNHPIPDPITRNRLNRMREGGILTDMALTSGLQVYHCHRIVVSAASPFIRQVIQTASALSTANNDTSVVVSMNEEHLPQMDHLMEFLYLGVLIIQPQLLHYLCKLADKLLIKFLIDGVVEEHPSTPMAPTRQPAKVKEAIKAASIIGEKRLPTKPVLKKNKKSPGTEKENEVPPPKLIKRNPSKQKNPKIIPVINGTSENSSCFKKGKKKVVKKTSGADIKAIVSSPHQPHCSTTTQVVQQPVIVPTAGNDCNDYTTPKTSACSPNNNNNASLAKRLKRKALNFLASTAQNQNSSIKRIPRRKQRIIKNRGRNENNAISVFKKNRRSTMKPIIINAHSEETEMEAEPSAVLHNENGQSRRKAYLKCGINVKGFIAQLKQRTYQ